MSVKIKAFDFDPLSSYRKNFYVFKLSNSYYIFSEALHLFRTSQPHNFRRQNFENLLSLVLHFWKLRYWGISSRKKNWKNRKSVLVWTVWVHQTCPEILFELEHNCVNLLPVQDVFDWVKVMKFTTLFWENESRTTIAKHICMYLSKPPVWIRCKLSYKTSSRWCIKCDVLHVMCSG